MKVSTSVMTGTALIGAAALGLALLGLAPSPAKAEPLIADLSEHRVSITTGFVGTDVLLFGATDGEGDVVVVVRGPARRELVRRKNRIGGIWVNDAEMAFDGVPAFYVVAANRAIAEIVPEALRTRHEIGSGYLRVKAEKGADPKEVRRFWSALVRNKELDQLYGKETRRVRFLGPRLFRTKVFFPANVPTGIYKVEVFLLRKGAVVGAQTTPLFISKAGIGAEVFEFAHRNSALYGIMAIAIALAAGWLAGFVFRKA